MLGRTHIVAVSCNIVTFAGGTSLSWPSTVVSKLSATSLEDNPLGRTITNEESSWIGAFLALGSIVGPFLFGILADKIGRRFTILSLGPPLTIAYLILAFAKIIELYYVARFIIGMVVGGMFTIIPMYTGEIAEDSNRGILSSVMNCLLTAGILFSYCLGPYINIKSYNITLATIPVVFIIIYFFASVESPYFYVAKNNNNAALECLHKLRRIDGTRKELDIIKISIEKSKSGNITDLFKSKGLIKAFIISLALVSFQQLSGISAILSFSQIIFAASSSDMKPEISSIIVGAVLFGTSFVTPLFVDKFGRKILLLISAAGMVVSQIALGVYFYLQDEGNSVDSVSWLPVVSLILYIITYNCGFGIIPWAIMGELFPPNLKSIASSLCSAFCWFISFLVIKFFQSIVDEIGMGPPFWIYAGFCALSFIFTIFFVIETKGKSLQEIQDMLET